MTHPATATARSMMEQITSIDNLTCAWQQVRRNIRTVSRARSRGVDRVSIADFEANWQRQMENLAFELRSGGYSPLPPRHLLIPKRDGGQRAIAVLAVRDRVAQRAVHQILEPIFEPTFLPNSFGCRPFIGAPHAVAAVDRLRRQGKHWIARADIEDFFGNIDHSLLLSILRRTIKEEPVLDLIRAWLDTGLLHDASLANEPRATWAQDALLAVNGHGADISGPHSQELLPDASLYRPESALSRELSEAGRSEPVREWYMESLQPDFTSVHTGRDLWRHAASDLGAVLLSHSGSYARPLLNGLGARFLGVGSTGLPVGLAGAFGVASAAGLSVLALAHLPGLRSVISRTGARGRGAVQGGALSPLLANIYLHSFDRAMARREHTFVRYVDDVILLGASQGEVGAALRQAERQLARLHLRLNARKSCLYGPGETVTFLGTQLLPVRAAAGHTWLSFADAEHEIRHVSVRPGPRDRVARSGLPGSGASGRKGR